MVEVRLTYVKEADRWEAIPVHDFVPVFIDEPGVRILVDEFSVAVGFIIDVDGDLESRIAVLRRYMNVDSFEANLRSEISDSEGIITMLSGHAVNSSTPALVSTAVGSRVLRTTQLNRGIAVNVSLSWWFALWGMWFTITRGDGLVLADLPIRRGTVEIVPNAFVIKPGDLRATMRRGPKTKRRILLVILAIFGLSGLIMIGMQDGTHSSATIDMVPTETFEITQSTVSVQTITLPPQREAATDYVSVDDRSHLDVSIDDPVVVPGTTLNVQFLYDKSAINTFGNLGPNGDQTDAFQSCQSSLDFYREVPSQPGASEQFRMYLVSGDGEQTLLTDLYVDFTLVGAMVEGCPEALSSGSDPYRVLQRTFYAPQDVPITIPADTERGKYVIKVELAAVEWADATNISIVVR